MALDGAGLFALVVNVAILGLALGLLYVNFMNRANRALALVLLLRSVANLSTIVPGAVGDPALVALGDRLFPYFFMAYFVSIFYLASVYPRLRAPLRGWKVPALPFLAAIAVVDVLYALDHSLWGGAQGPQSGPLGALFSLLQVAFGIAALLFVRDAAHATTTRDRSALMLLSMAFCFIQLHDSLVGAGVTLRFLLAGGPVAELLRLLPEVLSIVLPTIAFGALATVLAGMATREGPLRSLARRYLVGMGLAVATAAYVLAPWTVGVAGYFEEAWNLALPLLVGYAVVRHQIFGIDLKVRFAVKQSTLAGVFVGLFFVVSEGAQQVFSESIGPLLGIAAAGLLLFAISPLQHFADRVARATVPDAKTAVQLTRPERATIFRDAARTAWADGILDKNERAMLEQLRVTLGMSREEAAAIEHDASQ